jgi:hypothetical protein
MDRRAWMSPLVADRIIVRPALGRDDQRNGDYA